MWKKNGVQLFLWSTESYFLGTLVRPISTWWTGVTGFLTAYQNSQKCNQYYTAARETVTDPQVPAEPANCCSGEKSVPDVQTRPTRTSVCAHTHTHVDTLHISHSHARAHNTCTHRLTGMSWQKPHASKHTPEKATVNEARSRPKSWHQSGTLTPLGSRRTVSRICLLKQVLNNSKVKETILCISAYTASECARLVGSLPDLPHLCCLLQLCELWNGLFLLNDSFYLHETVAAQVRTAEHHHHTSHRGSWGLWKLASLISRKLVGFFLPRERLTGCCTWYK